MPRTRQQIGLLASTPPPRRSLGAGGFTIVEVMVASLILTLVFMGMISAMTASSGMMDQARRETVANQILNQELDDLRFASWSTISGMTATNPTPVIGREFWPTWISTANYVVNQVVSYNGVWYRCNTANTNQPPPNASYWSSVTSPTSNDIVTWYGATFTITCAVSDPATNIRQVTYTVTWTVKTSRRDPSGNPLSFTYSRSASAWYGKYGLNQTYQRS